MFCCITLYLYYGGLYGVGRGWLFSNLLLCSMIEVRWYTAIVLILVRVFVIVFYGI